MVEQPSYSPHWDREVANIDETFRIKWDKRRERFLVVSVGTFKGRRSERNIHWVETLEHEYLPVDQRLIDHLRRSAWMSRNPRLAAMLIDQAEAKDAKVKRDRREQAVDIAKDNKNFLWRAKQCTA